MSDGFLGYHIRRCNRNLLLVNGAILLAIIAVAFLARRYLINFAIGPTTMEKRDLRWNLNPDNELLYYVTLDADKELGAGYTDITRKIRKNTGQVISETVTAYYVVVLVNDRLLIVKSPIEHPGTHVTGTLVPIPPGVQQGFVQQVGAKSPEAGDRFLPYMLDSTGFRAPGAIGLVIGLPVLGLCLWNLKRGWSRLDPANHPIAKSVSRYGAFDDVEAKISAEMQEEFGTAHSNTPSLTRSWLAFPAHFGLELIHVTELLWVYQKTTKHSYNGIPTGSSYQAVVYHHRGMTETSKMTEGAVQRFLQSMYERAPWIVVGYSDELAGLWKRDASMFVHIVAERQQQVLGTAPAEQPAAAQQLVAPQQAPSEQIQPGPT